MIRSIANAGNRTVAVVFEATSRGGIAIEPSFPFHIQSRVTCAPPPPSFSSSVPAHAASCVVQGPVGDLLLALGRHNMRPNHVHMMVEAPGYRKLVTALYPKGDEWLASDAVFGVKKSLVVVSPSIVSLSVGYRLDVFVSV
jgi:hypothetical protein